MPWPGILDLLPFDLSLHNHSLTAPHSLKPQKTQGLLKGFTLLPVLLLHMNYHLFSVLTLHMGWISVHSLTGSSHPLPKVKAAPLCAPHPLSKPLMPPLPHVATPQ